MAKKELYRKIIATILTVAVLGCALGVCIWLLVSSTVFSKVLRITMLICTLSLTAAIIGLVICKVQEIRTLNEIVKKGQDLPASGTDPMADEHDDFLDELIGPLATPVSPVALENPLAEQSSALDGAIPAAFPEAALVEPAQFPPVPTDAVAAAAMQQSPTLESQPPHQQPTPVNTQQQPIQEIPSLVVQTPAPTVVAGATQPVTPVSATEEPAVQRNWNPINFRSLDHTHQQSSAQQPQMQPQIPPQMQPQVSAAAIEQANQQKLDDEARRAALLEQAARLQAERRAQQIQLAQAARQGNTPDVVQNEAYLAALARQAEQQKQMSIQMAQQAVAATQAQPAAAAVSPSGEPQPKADILQQMQPELTTAPASSAAASDTQVQTVAEEAPVIQKLNVKPIAWPAPPPPSKIFVTAQIPAITDEMIAAERARQAAQNAAGEWQKNS